MFGNMPRIQGGTERDKRPADEEKHLPRGDASAGSALTGVWDYCRRNPIRKVIVQARDLFHHRRDRGRKIYLSNDASPDLAAGMVVREGDP
jgi:hypothetical protein